MPEDDVPIDAAETQQEVNVEKTPVEEPVTATEETPVEETVPVTETPSVEETPVEDVAEAAPVEGDETGSEKHINRWIVVLGAIMIQLALGAIYSWSVFTPHLTKAIADGGAFEWTKGETQMIFSAGLVTFALVMILAGKLQAHYGPRKIALVGGVLLGAGYMAASFVGESFIGMLITIGIVGGAGIGMAYVVPIAVGIKWFPDKKGLISGLAVAGFGFGATIWVKLAGSWGNLIVNQGLHETFFIYGIIFLIMVVLGAFLMINPPAGYKPKGWNPPEQKEGAPTNHSFLPKQMLRTPQFWMIWMMFVFGALAGLMVIGIIKLYGIDALVASGNHTALEASAIAGTAMAVFYAIFNGIGRIAWGAISDKTGYKKALMAMFLFQAVMMFAVFSMGGNEYTLYLAAALIGFNFGGNFSLFPKATAELFGSKHVGQNYGFTFTSYGVGGVIGPTMIVGYFTSVSTGVDSWFPTFIIAGVLCVVAVVLAAFLKHPTMPEEKAVETTE